MNFNKQILVSISTKNKINQNILKKKQIKTSKMKNLHFNEHLKQGIFLKKPSFKKIHYPFILNLNLINEYLKKK